jgi:hypothetical protein
MAAVENTYEEIQRFLAVAKQPAIVEPGAQPILLERDGWQLELAKGRLTLHAWTRERNLVRRIRGLSSAAPGRLNLTIERFGKQPGALELVDLAKPKNHNATRRASRLAYREQLRRSLLRQFPGGIVTDISSDPDLQRSFSTSYARAMIRQGATAWAALGVAPEQPDADSVLSFGLIWLDYLRRRERRVTVQGLALFVPEGKQRNICLRLLHLRCQDVQWAVFIYGDGFEDRVDLRNYGNIDTVLAPAKSATLPPEWMNTVGQEPGVDTLTLPDGAISWRVNGLEFARFSGSRVCFGIETGSTACASNVAEIVALSRELVRRRGDAAVDRRSPLFQTHPESWLESRVRAHIADIDASLLPAPVYGQVPAIAAGERGVMDLLACDHAGRLAVVEVKVSEDLHLPLQALDYWIRVKWHLDRNEFTPLGFFPGIALQRLSPRLLLVAPALNFHPATESILRYFPSEMEIQRIGVSMDWRRDLKIAFRVTGRETPASHMWAAGEAQL